MVAAAARGGLSVRGVIQIGDQQQRDGAGKEKAVSAKGEGRENVGMPLCRQRRNYRYGSEKRPESQ